jgi:hypothetical protein
MLLNLPFGPRAKAPLPQRSEPRLIPDNAPLPFRRSADAQPGTLSANRDDGPKSSVVAAPFASARRPPAATGRPSGSLSHIAIAGFVILAVAAVVGAGFVLFTALAVNPTADAGRNPAQPASGNRATASVSPQIAASASPQIKASPPAAPVGIPGASPARHAKAESSPPKSHIGIARTTPASPASSSAEPTAPPAAPGVPSAQNATVETSPSKSHDEVAQKAPPTSSPAEPAAPPAAAGVSSAQPAIVTTSPPKWRDEVAQTAPQATNPARPAEVSGVPNLPNPVVATRDVPPQPAPAPGGTSADYSSATVPHRMLRHAHTRTTELRHKHRVTAHVARSAPHAPPREAQSSTPGQAGSFDQLMTELASPNKPPPQALTPPAAGAPDPFARRVGNGASAQ